MHIRMFVFMKTTAQFYKALSDETRLRILNLLLQAGELCVCDLESALDLSQPKISRHLSYLRMTGLVSDRKEGQWVYYRISSDLSEAQALVLAGFKSLNPKEKIFTDDVSRLVSLISSSCCKANVDGKIFQISVSDSMVTDHGSRVT